VAYFLGHPVYGQMSMTVIDVCPCMKLEIILFPIVLKASALDIFV